MGRLTPRSVSSVRARLDAVVIGGGLLGTATAYHLVSAGARTLLVDRADTGRATDAGAGILSPKTNSRDSDAWFRLAGEAADYYPTLIETLGPYSAKLVAGQLLGTAPASNLTPFSVERFASRPT